MKDKKRIELKAILRTTDVSLLESWIVSETTLVSLFPDREINNIYFDSEKYGSVVDNIDGISQRTKVRYRWYGNSDDSMFNGILEFKRKRNNAGWKEQYPISIQNSSDHNYLNIIREIKRDLPTVKEVEFSLYRMPFILNNYMRKYYSTEDRKVRVTVDSSISAYDQRWGLCVNRKKRIILPSIIIVEFKFAIADKNKAIQLMKQFPFRISKHSKYITSVLHV